MDRLDPIRLRDAVWLRPWRATDAPALALHANNRNVSRHLRDRFPYPYHPSDAERFLALAVAQDPPRNLAIEVDGEAAGSVALTLHDDVGRGTAEIGYWLAEPCWGRGIMTDAVRAMVAHGFDRFALRRIEARVFSSNPASARVLEKAGFTLEGRLRAAVIKDGEILDALVYAILSPGARA